MTDNNDDSPRFADPLLADALLAELRAWPTAPPSRGLSARVLARAHAALTEERTTRAQTPSRAGRLATSSAVASAVIAAVGVYLTWAVDFLVRLCHT
jgi:hypothetical protein